MKYKVNYLNNQNKLIFLLAVNAKRLHVYYGWSTLLLACFVIGDREWTKTLFKKTELIFM